MTVKALKRQLMAAIAMIMVSLIALSSSTYAWFTMNKTVTAKGLTVKARTEGGIVIKRAVSTSGEGQDSTIFASQDTVNLFPTNKGPTSAISGKEFKDTWVHATAVKAEEFTADQNTYTFLTLSQYPPGANNLGYGYSGNTWNGGNFYYVYDTFIIQKDKYSKSFTDLYVSECTVKKKDGTATDVGPISKALRVLVKCGSREFIYAPVEGAAAEYNIITGITKTDTSLTLTKTPISSFKITDGGNEIPVYKNTSKTGTMPLSKEDGRLYDGVYDDEVGNGLEVSVYVYFEGEDQSLNAFNIKDGLDELVLTIKFSCSDVIPN